MKYIVILITFIFYIAIYLLAVQTYVMSPYLVACSMSRLAILAYNIEWYTFCGGFNCYISITLRQPYAWYGTNMILQAWPNPQSGTHPLPKREANKMMGGFAMKDTDDFVAL